MSPSGLSTLMTVAPRSASIIVIYGPARTREKSATIKPARAVGVELPGSPIFRIVYCLEYYCVTVPPRVLSPATM